MSSSDHHSIPFDFDDKRFHSSYPLNFENRINRQHFKTLLQNCSKIVRKCCRNIDNSDRLLKYTMIIYIIIMVFSIVISIIAISLLSTLVEWIYPFIVCVVVSAIPTIGFGYAIYQRGKKIKEFHSKCQTTLEKYIMEENQKTIRVGIQWFVKYNSDRIGLFSHRQTRYLITHPKIEISDRELQFSFETNPQQEDSQMEEDYLEDENFDNLHLLHNQNEL